MFLKHILKVLNHLTSLLKNINLFIYIAKLKTKTKQKKVNSDYYQHFIQYYNI